MLSIQEGRLLKQQLPEIPLWTSLLLSCILNSIGPTMENFNYYMRSAIASLHLLLHSNGLETCDYRRPIDMVKM
jgi:hypothetical protein